VVGGSLYAMQVEFEKVKVINIHDQSMKTVAFFGYTDASMGD